MSRVIVSVTTIDGRREPDYNGGYKDARYWDDSDNIERFNVDEGEVSIIPLQT